MSTNEQDAALLRLVKGRAESKKTMALLEQELRECALTMLAFAEPLRRLDLASYPPEWIDKGVSLLSPSLAGKIREFVSADQKLRELNATAMKLGID
jgi:hypothetical protein